MIPSKLYHAEVFMPKSLRMQAKTAIFKTLIWTDHALREAASEKYGIVSPQEFPKRLVGHLWDVIELEVTNERVTKYVYRRKIDETRSLVLVIRPKNSDAARVITCWINLINDTHKTLDRTRYATS